MIKLEVQKIKFGKVTFYAFQIKNQFSHMRVETALGI